MNKKYVVTPGFNDFVSKKSISEIAAFYTFPCYDRKNHHSSRFYFALVIKLKERRKRKSKRKEAEEARRKIKRLSRLQKAKGGCWKTFFYWCERFEEQEDCAVLYTQARVLASFCVSWFGNAFRFISWRDLNNCHIFYHTNRFISGR